MFSKRHTNENILADIRQAASVTDFKENMEHNYINAKSSIESIQHAILKAVKLLSNEFSKILKP